MDYELDRDFHLLALRSRDLEIAPTVGLLYLCKHECKRLRN